LEEPDVAALELELSLAAMLPSYDNSMPRSAIGSIAGG